MSKKNERQQAIRQVVRDKALRTQGDLVQELAQMGIICTQATVSRDIASMGLRKLSGGAYVLAEDLHLQRMMGEFASSVVSVSCFCVIKTQAGTAPGVAAAIDGVTLEGVMGTLAGNDTVLVICSGDESAANVSSHLNVLMGSSREGFDLAISERSDTVQLSAVEDERTDDGTEWSDA